MSPKGSPSSAAIRSKKRGSGFWIPHAVGLIADDADPVPRGAEVPQARGRVGVQVLRRHRVRNAGSLALPDLVGQVKAGAEDPEGLAMLAASLDHRAAYGQGREPP